MISDGCGATCVSELAETTTAGTRVGGGAGDLANEQRVDGPARFVGGHAGQSGIDHRAHALDLFADDGVGLLQHTHLLGGDLTEDAHAQAGAGERVAVDHVVRQAERDSEFTYFVLEQFAQRFQQLQMHVIGQATETVLPLARQNLGRGQAAIGGEITVLVFIVIFIQKRPQGIFALKGRSAEA